MLKGHNSGKISRVCWFVDLLFYVHGKHLRSGGSVNLTTLFLGRLRPPKRLTSTSCTYFRQWLTTALLETAEGETKVCYQTGYRTQDLWLTSQAPYRLRYAARPVEYDLDKICTSSGHGNNNWKVSSKSLENCRRSCEDKIVSTDRRTDGRTDGRTNPFL